MPRSVLGVAARAAVRLGGGAMRVDLVDGRTVVVKTGRPTAVAAEVAGLRWLRVPGGPAVPAVLAAQRNQLVTEFVPGRTPSAEAAGAFGRELAAMHSAGASAFGAAPPGGPADAWIGRAAMRNAPAAGWPQWYAADRMLPYLRGARDAGVLSGAATGVVEQVCDRLPELAGPPEPPARLHGDLWSGNVLWSGAVAGSAGPVRGRGWIIDPAAHGGHRETDLAMLALFGCPHLDDLLSAYTEASPLATGWRERTPLHQLFPLLVHAVLFGPAYAGQVLAAAHAALRLR